MTPEQGRERPRSPGGARAAAARAAAIALAAAFTIAPVAAPWAGCAAEQRGFDVKPGVGGADQALARACRLAEQRCSRCHPLDRVLTAHVADPVDWENYVSRMRRTPGSGIREDEEEPLVRCLVHHSFGPEAAR
jgi:hypothetical protein